MINEPGEGEVLQMVSSSNQFIGLANAGTITGFMAANGNKEVILAIDDQANSKVCTPTTTTNKNAIDNVNNEIKYNGNTWPAGLIQPLNLVTNGPATSAELNFIRYCQSPTDVNQNAFSQGADVHISQVNPAFIE